MTNNQISPEHQDEFQKSTIAKGVMDSNFRSIDGYPGFDLFISECNLTYKDRINTGCINRKIQKLYDHLHSGYWFVMGWNPLTNETEFVQCKPNTPRQQLDFSKRKKLGFQTETTNQNHPEKGSITGSVQQMYQVAQILRLWETLPQIKGKIDKQTIENWTPEERYNWCYQNQVFDYIPLKTIKYETPKGQGTPFIFLNIPISILEKVAQDYNLTLPEGYQQWDVGEKWQWIKDNPIIPIFITEGTKKAASLISHNKIAIASMSITTHSLKGTKQLSSWFTELKPELLWLLKKKSTRTIYVVFDAADEKEASRQAVKRETRKICQKLKKYGIPKIITWDDKTCKGIDDFIFKHKQAGLEKLIVDAIDFNQQSAIEAANYLRPLHSDEQIHQKYILDNIIEKARKKSVKLLCLKSAQNTGKTTACAKNLQEYDAVKAASEKHYQLGDKVIIKVGESLYESTIEGYNPIDDLYACKYADGYTDRKASQISYHSHITPEKLYTLGLTHRQSLAWNLSKRFNLDCYLDKIIPLHSQGIMTCVDSILTIPEEKQFNNMIIDECGQVAWHLVASTTEISKNRMLKIARLRHYGMQVINNHGMIIIMDADLTDADVKFYQMLFGIHPKDTYVIENTYQPFKNKRKCLLYNNVQSLRHQIIQAITQGKRIIIHTSGQKESSTHGTINIEKEILDIFPELEEFIYRIDKESVGDDSNKSYQILTDLERLKKARIVIASSSINTGVSLDEEVVGTFDKVFGIFYGNYPLTDFEQAVERYRGDCERHVYLKNASSTKIDNGNRSYNSLLKNVTGQSQNIQTLLQDEVCDLAMDFVNFYCKFAARINNDYKFLKNNFRYHLEAKGYTLDEGETVSDKQYQELKKKYKMIKNNSENGFIDKVEATPIPDKQRLEELEKAKTKTKDENVEEYKGQLAKRYKTHKITRELIMLDRQGLYPQLLLRFWFMFGQQQAIKRDKRVLNQYSEHNEGKGYAIDFNNKSVSTQVATLEYIGLYDCVNGIANIQTTEILIMLLAMQFNPLWLKVVKPIQLSGLFCEDDVKPYMNFENNMAVRNAFQQTLNVNIAAQHSPMKVLGKILPKIGYAKPFVRKFGASGKQKRYYRLVSIISEELWTEIYEAWLAEELNVQSKFEQKQQSAA